MIATLVSNALGTRQHWADDRGTFCGAVPVGVIREDRRSIVPVCRRCTKTMERRRASDQVLALEENETYFEFVLNSAPVAEAEAPALAIHTAGELHPAPEIGRVTFTFNLSDLLADPERKLPEHLVQLDGTDARVEDFVFATEGALDLIHDIGAMITRQLARGKKVVVLILCRGGKHRSVAFGETLGWQFHGDAAVTHHHKDLHVVRTPKG